MKTMHWILFGVALMLIGATAGLLSHQRAHQRLGAPGVKTRAIEGTNRVDVVLPETVLNYESKWLDVDELTYNALPKDTSFGQRHYTGPDGFQMALNVVLMGRDRTSLHKPQFCLTGQGFTIDQAASAADRITIEKPSRYELPVVKLISTKQVTVDGQTQTGRGVYVYWYVADDMLSASVSGFERMWVMGRRLLQTGVLQRWAYVSCFAVCAPGQEEATYERMKQFIAVAVPEFQLVVPAVQTAAVSEPPQTTSQK
ncbi:MAG TPA: exosortase-associated EpsI family protein [Clostridia bacterium]|nr:exosortase-associated EpsI family protein [Clostridia bacterium]